jgi:4-amino-4-deoxy-L-arabinose transferase-like glycosyltransferase
MNFLERYPRWVLTCLACLYLLPGTWLLPLVDRDEPRFSRATVEMMDRDNYVVPYFNNEYRFDKPPLTYWWMQLHYRLLGVTELGARLHSTAAAWLISLLIFGFARRMGYEPRWALLAGAIWLSSLQVLIHGRIAVADMPLILGATMALRGLWDSLFAKTPSKLFGAAFWMTYLGMAFAFLAKGPLALLIPGLSLAVLGLFGRGAENITWRPFLRGLLPGILVFLVLIGAWGIPALLQTKGAYFDVGIGEHVVERGVSSFNERFYLPGVYYFVAILIFFSPWVPALWPSLRAAWRDRKMTPGGLLLVGWAASSFIIFAFYKTQLPHYILPSYPALALLAAGYLRHRRRTGFQISYTVTRIALSALTLVALILGWVFMKYGATHSLGTAALWLSALLFGLLIASECVKRNRLSQAIICSLASAFLFWPFASNVRESHLVVQLHEAHAATLTAAPHAYGIGFAEPSLVWYSGRFWDFNNTPTAAEMKSGDVLLFSTRRWRLDDDLINDWRAGEPLRPRHDKRAQLEAEYGDLEIETIQGFSPGNSSWFELALVRKP